jgi:hypothetical protein
MVNEISCDASPDIIPRKGNKGKRHGMMHTHLHCKQQEMTVVDDEVGLTRKERGRVSRPLNEELEPTHCIRSFNQAPNGERDFV